MDSQDTILEQRSQTSQTYQQEDLNLLSVVLSSKFNKNELKNLSFRLGIKYEELDDTLTLSGFVRELILYCERWEMLDCLALKVMEERSLNDDRLMSTLSKFLFVKGSCLNRESVVVIARGRASVILDNQQNEFLEVLSNFFDIPEEEIRLQGVVKGSIRLLINLPIKSARMLVERNNRNFTESPLRIISTHYYFELDELSQTAWRILVEEYPNFSEQIRNWTVFPKHLHWKIYIEKARNSIQEMHKQEIGKFQELKPIPQSVTTTNNKNLSSDIDKMFVLSISGLFLGAFITMLLIRFLKEPSSTEYRIFALSIGVIASVLMFLFHSNKMLWSIIFILGYGLGFLYSVLLLEFDRIDLFVTLLGNLVVYFLVSFVIIFVLRLVKQLLASLLKT